MLTQKQLKYLTSLGLRKFREEYGQFTAEGHKLVLELAGSRFKIAGIYALRSWLAENSAAMKAAGCPVEEVTEGEMKRISSLSTPSPVLAVVEIPETKPEIDCLSQNLVLALDDIRDPGNMGTIIRIADWFGIGTILCSETCVELYNPKVVQATMGSITRVRVVRGNLPELIRNAMKSHDTANVLPVFGALLDGRSLYDHPLNPGGIIVIGNESRGISTEILPLVTERIHIPAYGLSSSGKAESLNASVATAVICAEFRRRFPAPSEPGTTSR